MAKYEAHVTGNFDELLSVIHDGILRGSISASYEEGGDYRFGDTVRCAVRAYERYSAFGKNRVSLHVTLLGDEKDLFVCAITTGGSQAVFFKINTVGEETFLDKLIEIVENYKH